MRKIRKILSAIIALFMLTSSLAACSNDEQQDNSVGESTASAESTVTTAETEAPYPEAPVKDLDGFTFRVAQSEPSHAVKEKLIVIEEQTGDAVLDAIFERNKNVEEKLNVSITQVKLESFNQLKTTILAGDDFCEIANTIPDSVFPVLSENMFLDFAEISTIDLSNPWWDQHAVEELDINGKTYMLTGDMMTTDEFHTVCLIYSVNLFEDFGYGSPYGMVKDSTWTLDKFLEMSSEVASDIDGDGKMGEKDRWGFTTEYAMLRWLAESFGARSLVKGKNGFEYSVNDEDFLAVTESVVRLATMTDVVTMAGDGKITESTYGSVFYHMEALFAQDLALFHSGTFDDLTRMRTYDADYGIVPLPKFNEMQDDYYHSVSWSAAQVFMPMTIKDPENAGIVLENMGWESHFILTPVFYDLFMSEKLSRDEESKEMLDIIFSTKYYDLDDYLNLSGVRNIMYAIGEKKQNTFASDWAAKESSALANLAKFNESMK